MRTRSEVVVGAGGALRRLDTRPPLTIRQVRSDTAGTCALCLVGTAAGPLAGDDLELSLELEDGACASLEAAGASIAQGGASGYRTSVRLGAGARLVARPGPVIVSRQASIDLCLAVDVAADASLDWREVLVLGRTGESGGAARLQWDVVRDGRPVLRQDVDLSERSWAGLLAHRRVLATQLRTGPDVPAHTVVLSSTAVAARLDEHTVLLTVLADDTATAAADLDALCHAFDQRSDRASATA